MNSGLIYPNFTNSKRAKQTKHCRFLGLHSSTPLGNKKNNKRLNWSWAQPSTHWLHFRVTQTAMILQMFRPCLQARGSSPSAWRLLAVVAMGTPSEASCAWRVLPLADGERAAVTSSLQGWPDELQRRFRAYRLTSFRCPRPLWPPCICASSQCERWTTRPGWSGRSPARRRSLHQLSPRLPLLHKHTVLYQWEKPFKGCL